MNFESNPWCISDTHFFHANIIKYCNRPNNWQDNFIITWNNLIKPEDNVLHLGDLLLGKFSTLEFIVKLLPGKIFLLKGNHDRFTNTQYDKVGIKLVKPEIRYKNLIFTHWPMEKVPASFINVHGHIHNNSETQPRHFNLSIEVMNYVPIRLFDLMERIKNGK